MLFRESIVCLFSLLRHSLREKFFVVEVHVPHIVLAGIVTNVELRVHGFELLKRIFHREYTTNHDGRLSIHSNITLENFRETLVHSLGNTTMLLSATKSQFSIALPSLVLYSLYLRESLFALCCQHALFLSFQQHVVRTLVVVSANKIA